MCSNTPVYCHVVVVIEAYSFMQLNRWLFVCVCWGGQGRAGFANWAFFGNMNRAIFPSCGRLHVLGYYNCGQKVGTYFILSGSAKNDNIFSTILLRNVY